MDRQFYLDDQGNLKENGLRGSPLGNLIGMMVVILGFTSGN
jgi:hypothetical protein